MLLPDLFKRVHSVYVMVQVLNFKSLLSQFQFDLLFFVLFSFCFLFQVETLGLRKRKKLVYECEMKKNNQNVCEKPKQKQMN